MRIIVVGDVHGTIKWREIEPRQWDKIIFLGDYVDSFTVEDSQIVYNLNELINFKKNNPNKVVLLIGNHDNAYALKYDVKAMTNRNISYDCSGHRSTIAPQLYKMYSENMDLFQATYQINNYLFSHAGLSRHSFNEYFKEEYNTLKETMTLSEYLNMLYDKRDERLFRIGIARGGYYRSGGIFWADKEETSGKFRVLNNYNQIVGHTPVQNITTSAFENGTITYCDSLEHYNGNFYVLEFN